MNNKKIKIAIIISDDVRWEKLESKFTDAGYEMDKDYNSYPSLFDEDNEFINFDNYETLLIHKTDSDADVSGKFNTYLKTFEGSIVFFSGGIEISEIKEKYLSINYDEYFKKNLIPFLKNYKKSSKANLYDFLGGKSRYFIDLRNKLLNSLLNTVSIDKKKCFWKSIVYKFVFFSKKTPNTPINVDIINKIEKTKELTIINTYINNYLNTSSNDKFFKIRNEFNKIIYNEVLKERK